jgi:hypothetical protein
VPPRTVINCLRVKRDRFIKISLREGVPRKDIPKPAGSPPKNAIFGQNYGQAGAIDMFGPKYSLPPAISGHQNYFLWGQRGYTGESVIVLAGHQQDLESRFTSVQKVASVYHPYSMPYEHFDVFYCRGPKRPLNEIWPQVKNWD